MSLHRLGTEAVVTCPPTTSVLDIARLMTTRDVGSVVITDGQRPVGIVTDRDLVLRVLRRRFDAGDVRVEQVMSTPVETVPDDTDALAALELMNERHVRRLPLTNDHGEVVGIVTYDDLVRHVGIWAAEASRAIGEMPLHSGRGVRPAPHILQP
jgi:CBS domain-containing protein